MLCSGGARKNAGRGASAGRGLVLSEYQQWAVSKNFNGQCPSYYLKTLNKGHGFYESADDAWKFRCRRGAR